MNRNPIARIEAAPEPDTMGLVRQKVKDIVEYIISDGKGYNGVSGDIENKINTALNEVDVLFDSGLVAPDPDIELTSDTEFGFVARYKSLTADGKTKDEAMQELAKVILAAYDLDNKCVPTAMLEEAYARGYQDVFGNVKDMDYDTLAAKYGYHVE